MKSPRYRIIYNWIFFVIIQSCKSNNDIDGEMLLPLINSIIYLPVFVSIATDEKFALLFNLIGLDWMTGLSVNHIMKIDTSKKETPHSFKGQQLKNKSLYRFVIYKGFR